MVNTSVKDAVEFYRNEMAALGWELSYETTMDMLASLEYKRGERSLSITIIQSGSFVMVTVQLM